MTGNQPLDWLRDVWFMAGLQTKTAFIKTNKKSAQRSKGTGMTTMNKTRRQPSTGQKERQTYWPIEIIFTQESIPCTNSCVCIMLFACTLRTWS